MVYQDREPLYFYDLAVHGAFAFLILVFLLNIFASSINSFFREHKRSITFRLSFSLLKKSIRHHHNNNNPHIHTLFFPLPL